MENKRLQESDSTWNPIITAVANYQRRRTLGIVRSRSASMDVEDLATHLAAERFDKRLFSVTKEEFERALVDLRHRHLPVLADANLIEWDDAAGTVSTTNHPAHENPKFERILNVETDDWDDILDCLADQRRRIVLSVVSAADGALERETLATKVAAREYGVTEVEVPSRDVKDVLLSLHHVHLPKLDEAELVEYDRTVEAVTHVGHSALDEEWLLFETEETPRALLSDADHSDDIWTIQGTENIVARAHSLFDQADDELFIMATTTGLIQKGCIRRLQAAIDRGVDVYVGSQTPEVRDLVRERLPEAVIWEPQMDWLNMSPSDRRVGRLVFADREAIMLGTLGDEVDDGAYEETAITGTGSDNSVVMLLRELLGSRLDHLDAQSEDLLAQLPL